MTIKRNSPRAGFSRRKVITAAPAIGAGVLASSLTVESAQAQQSCTNNSKPSMSYVTGQPELFFTKSGEGPKNIILLHGWACDSHDWSRQLPVYEEKYTTVAVDLRGHGKSEVTETGYAPENFVDDVEALIESQFGSQPVILVGHSMGGQIAVRLASKRPELVEALILADATIGLPDAYEKPYSEFSDKMDAGIPGEIAPPLFKSLYTAESDPAIVKWHARRIQGMAPHVLQQSIRPLFLGPNQVALGKASEDICRTVKCPVLGFHRTESRVNTVRPWFENEKSHFEPWIGSGHWVQLDRPEIFNTTTVKWIDQL